jgi:hypothetical protein
MTVPHMFALMATGGGGVPFDPSTDLSGIIRFHDASDSATLTLTGSVVDQMNDTSGVGNHLTASGSTRPTRLSASQNGLDTLDFDGSDDRLFDAIVQANTIMESSTAFVYTVVNPTRTGTGLRTVWGEVESTGAQNGSGYRLFYDRSNNRYQVTFTSNNNVDRFSLTADAAVSGWDLVIVRDLGPLGGAELEVYGVDSASVGSWTTSTTTVNAFGLGYTARATPALFYDGEFGQLIACNADPGADEALLIAHLVAKWGI